MNFPKYSAILIALFFLIVVESEAQKIKPNRRFISAEGGVTIFYGDIKRYDYIPDHQSPSEIQPIGSLNIGKEISPVFSLRSQFLYGGLSGHKNSAHMNFKSVLMGAHLITDINLVHLFTKTRFGDNRLNIYASLGAGYIYWNSELYNDIVPVAGTSLIASSKTGALSIPGSLTIEYLFNKNFSMNIQGMLYVVTSDLVDVKEGGIKTDMINYNSMGFVYKFKSKSRKNTYIKYELDPSVYEPKAVVEQENKKPDEPVVIIPNKVVVDTVKKADDNMAINHKLEQEALTKENWVPQTEEAWPETVFTVQIMASKTKGSVDKIKRDFGITENITERFEGSWYKYSVGSYDKLWKAKEMRNKLRSTSKLSDAFIVIYRNEDKISLEDAMNYAVAEQMEASGTPVEQKQKVEKVYPPEDLSRNIPGTGNLIGVQILSLKNSQYPLGVLKGMYDISNPVYVDLDGPWYKIIVGGFNSVEEARAYSLELRAKGFMDAFVVTYKSGTRVSVGSFSK